MKPLPECNARPGSGAASPLPRELPPPNAIASPSSSTPKARTKVVKRVLSIEGTAPHKGPLNWLQSWGLNLRSVTDVACVHNISSKASLEPSVLQVLEDVYTVGAVRGIEATRLATGVTFDTPVSLYFVLVEASPQDVRIFAIVR